MGISFVVGPVESAVQLNHILEGLVRCNMAYVGRVPPLLSSGVRYKREPLVMVDGRRRRREQWQTNLVTYQRRHGDCEDLACYLAAEMRARGYPAKPLALPSPVGFHIVVECRGRRIDPSAMLGMKGAG